ncbi:MAG: 2-amino-4-hydroxy-6-hydroxymethyldihydropteridine diphosphokinase [Flavobacteriales bacterium]|nr:2-amino-4-hydroxy-6-hydroxymethyldihydropteridine diphosphokinase [Flavobacteriales bacterium]
MRYYLSLGGNIGDTTSILKKAIDDLAEKIGAVEKVSSFLRTAPWGFHAENDFINVAVILVSEKKPQDVLSLILEIEKKYGRERSDAEKGYQSRPLDIDIIFIDYLLINTETLTVPHPLAHRRCFVLKPLCEIAPDFIHPTLCKSIKCLLDECQDV